MTLLLVITLVALCGYAAWHVIKPLPTGLNLAGRQHPINADHIHWLADLTSMAPDGQLRSEQQIFTRLFALIDQAEHYILIDFFLLNDHQNSAAPQAGQPLAAQLINHLLARKQQRPALMIDVLTDPINRAYHGELTAELSALRAAGINLILTDLEPLRDSNPLYSLWWRLVLRRVPNFGRALPHPFDAAGGKVGLSSWLQLINFKANHRKVAVIDQGGQFVSLVTSANPHGASHRHSNLALLICDNALAAELHRSEQAVARLSGGRLRPLPPLSPNHPSSPPQVTITVQLVTEQRIKNAIGQSLDRAGAGDRIRLAMFYLADRQVIAALLAADRRGAQVELILDPNRDAFGYRKNGVPNRPVAAELRRKSTGNLTIRWYQTHGEQFHPKMVLVEYADGHSSLCLGSANLTRRNLDNYNLETNLLLQGATSAAPLAAATTYFDTLWHNCGADYTVAYPQHADEVWWKYVQYRLQEQVGLGTF